MKLIKEIIKLTNVVITFDGLIPWIFIIAGMKSSGDNLIVDRWSFRMHTS